MNIRTSVEVKGKREDKGLWYQPSSFSARTAAHWIE